MTPPDRSIAEKTVIAPLRRPGGTTRPPGRTSSTASAPPVPVTPQSNWPMFVLAGAAVLLLGATAAFIMIHVLTGGRQTEFSEAQLDQELVPVETVGEDLEPVIPPPEDQPQGTLPKIIDLSGNPMIVERRQTLTRQQTKVTVAAVSAKALQLQGEVYRMTDSLAARASDLPDALPTSQQSFAFFQSASDVEGLAVDDPGVAPDSSSGSSTVTARDESADGSFSREPITEDIPVETPLSKVVVELGFAEDAAKDMEAAAARLLGLTVLAKGDVIALRANRGPETDPVPVQLSIYRNGQSLGTVSLTDHETYGLGEDPWFGQNIFHKQIEQAAAKAKHRLLDAIYTSAVRNNIPTSVAGETILLLSRAHDLEQPAGDGDNVVILYGSKPRDRKTGFGRVLYVRIERSSGNIECYSFQPKAGAPFECVSGDGEGTAVDGMTAPVKGVMAGKFGPYTDPVTKKTRMNFGVDWAAPAGTPVFAAFAGQVVFAGRTEEWGNTVKIAHQDKTLTLYGNLKGFAANLAEGREVKTGQRIGFVGQASAKAEPKLHFELHRNGQPTDPFGTYQAQIEKGGAIESLVYRITTVESGNRCNAANPLSTAVGLGQFIKSTWLKIIRDHRPDLMQGRSTAEILALRTDCVLARQMTTALTRENSNYIRRAGHTATSGNLYLAHFLGPGGATKALSSPSGSSILNVFGSGVVNANPFLRGQTTGWLIDWAARKMNRKGPVKIAPAGASPAPQKPIRFAENAQFAQLKKAVEIMLK